MTLRSGIYMVPLDRWYVERTVWLIAGAVLVSATALALLVNPLFILLVVCTGLSSVAVAVTGLCFVGSALLRLGFQPKIGDPARGNGMWYFMQTDRWFLERRIYLVVGINMTIASVLSLVHSVWWLAFIGFVGVAMFWFAATGFCIMANMLYWLGAEPRLGAERKALAAIQTAGHPARA